MKRFAAAAALLLFVTSVSPSMGLPPLVVTNTNDSGAGSLRQAILDANAGPDTSDINFGLLGAGPHTIAPLSALPTITEPVVIDGFTQSGSSRNTHSIGQPSNAVIMIFLSGVSAGPSAPGIHARADTDIYGLDVSGFSSYGMLLSQGSYVVEGCHIGVSGANAFDGIYLDEGDGSRIGGAPAGTHNVISGNGGSGVAVNKTSNALIQGNYIGVAPDGTSSLGNGGAGVEMLDDATGNTIGGAPNSNCTSVPVRAANVIAHNGSDGVTISDVGFIDAERNRIWSNSIHSNGRLGIDLLPNGVTANDANDVDTGANRRQNFPMVVAVDDSIIKFSLDMAPSTTFTVQFFRSAACDASGNGEGETYLFQTSLATDAGGDAGVNVECVLIPPASMITATATDPLGNTSEFSPCVQSKNTIAGSTRWIGVPDEDGDLLANIQFGSVTTGGNTFVTPGAVPPEPVPGSFQVEGTPTYYDVSTTAVFNTAQGVDVCLHYDEATLPGDEDDVVLLHYDSVLGDWVDVTTSRNTTTHFVCGHVSDFSPFVVAVPTAPTDVDDPPTPRSFALHPNVPNPFNPQTTIHYDVPASGADVNIAIYDVAGRLVRELVDERRAAGRWSVQWNGEGTRGERVASGVYFYRMRAGSFVETKKMVLLK